MQDTVVVSGVPPPSGSARGGTTAAAVDAVETVVVGVGGALCFDNNNKPHKCGSLFANCSCRRTATATATKQPGAATESTSSNEQKAAAVAFCPIKPIHRGLEKRRSHPEVFRGQRCVEFLQHPDIPFPVPLNGPTGCYSTNKAHRVSGFQRARPASESEELARKFWRDFGITAPPPVQSAAYGGESMGNGVSIGHHRSSKQKVAGNQDKSRDAKIINVSEASKKKSSFSVAENVPADYEYLKNIVPRLEKDLRDLEIKNASLNSELQLTKKELQQKESNVGKLQREIHKLKSVLQQTTSVKSKQANDELDDNILSSLHHNIRTSVNQTSPAITSSKKQGVSAESSESSGVLADITIPKHDKDFRSKQLIKDAILDNDFLKNLDSSQIREIVDSMYPRGYEEGAYVIREGDVGAHLFVSAEGEFEVIKDGNILGRMGIGKAFGELAILYNCTRTASIRVVANSNVWVLDRKIFQQIMVRTGLQRMQDNVNFLRSVPLLQNLSNQVLAKIADVLEVEFYPSGAYIIRQGASGDTFFIISSGRVKITQRLPGRLEEEPIRTLERGDYFGEQALLKEDYRTASVIALHPGVECLTLDRDSFIQLIGDLSEIKEKDYGDGHRTMTRPISSTNMQELVEYDHIQLDDLDVLATLGIGGFGRVELVQYSRDPSLTFSLKCLKKRHIVDTHQQEHVFSERNVMMSCRSNFICRMYKTFKDTKYVYMLLEACLGGEVWTILRDRGCFDEYTTKFITACVVEAFDYLHARGIIYRDLKPENLLLDSKGYVKLVDFGFSKRLGYSSKTWTFCGTPEYVAPETILNKGHDRAVDYWALGILMHELLSGNPPFSASDQLRTYNLILKGIDMIDFAKYHIGKTAQSLIKKLCRDLPSERLGYQRGGIQDIKKHKWFQGFDWDGLNNGTLQAPIVQRVRGPTDFSNFDSFRKDTNIPADEVSGWDKDF